MTTSAPAPTRPLGARVRRRAVGASRRAATGWLFVGPSTLVILGLSLFPAGWAFYLAQLKWNGFSPARGVGFRNYERMVDDPDLASAALHTLFFTLLYVPTSVFLGLGIALALNRRIRFIGLYRTAIFVPFVASAAATGILANYLFDPQFGFVNNALRRVGLPAQRFLEDPNQAMTVIALMSLWASLGFTVVVYLAALQDIPRDLVEAAVVDGANRWQVFRHVVLPQLTPVTVFTTIWQLIGSLQLFDLVYTTTRGGPVESTKTIVYYLWEQAFKQLNFGYGSAVAYVLFAATMVITLGMIVYSRFAKVQAF